MMALNYKLVFITIIILLAILPTSFTQNIFTYTEELYQTNLTSYPPRVLYLRHYSGSEGAVVVHIGRKLNFGPSYLIPNTTTWYPNEFVVNNIIPEKGFLRLSAISGTRNFEWSQYSHLMTSTRHNDDAFTSFQLTVFATLDGGYAVVYANTTTINTTFEFTPTAGIYVLLLGYNQTSTPKRIILYELPQKNLTFNQLYCSVDYVAIGHSCIIALAGTSAAPIATTVPQSVSSQNTEIFYVKIRFLSSGALLSLDLISNNTFNANVKTLPYGGYIIISRELSKVDNISENLNFSLFDEENKPSDYSFPQKPIVANLFGTLDVTQNNTFLVALNESSLNTWSLLSISLPKLNSYNDNGYGNFHISDTYPQNKLVNLELGYNTINITYHDSIRFSDGNLTIYQTTSDGSFLRQTINSRTCDTSTKCQVFDKVVILKILDCTFNEPSGTYYIKMDTNFVQSAQYGEPMLGIDPNMWTFQTGLYLQNYNPNRDNSTFYDNGITGSIRLTLDGTQLFQNMSSSEKSVFLAALVNEFTIKVPTEKGRLNTNQNVQLDTSSKSNLLILLSINGAKSGNKLNSNEVKKNLDQLIRNKQDTPISIGNSSYLDDFYGFQTTRQFSDLFDANKTKFIIVFVAIAINLLIFLIFRLRSPDGDNLIILTLGLTIFRFVSYLIFVIFDSTVISFLYAPSISFLVIPVAVNLILSFSVLVTERSKEFIDWLGNYTRVAVTIALLSGANIDLLSLIKSYLMGWDFLNAPLSRNALRVIFWGGCVSILLADIPQLVIQAEANEIEGT
ncbi:21792_t:CDS:10 [Cetraspora pellucida]|uniref:21792_t:CDS:1 n=1 Tax=Cetraspora pellucida TaxID=1433469 RepID=A0A9N9GJ60_9GLOM|nr:21792_t:CDS:10 [Cetraspora pellucida]